MTQMQVFSPEFSRILEDALKAFFGSEGLVESFEALKYVKGDNLDDDKQAMDLAAGFMAKFLSYETSYVPMLTGLLTDT